MRFAKKTRSEHGQTTLEYSILVIVILGALISMSVYMKRGVQGRWKEAVDSLGDQYDPRLSNAEIIHSIQSETLTEISITDADGGFFTNRTDMSNSAETKTGFVTVGTE